MSAGPRSLWNIHVAVGEAPAVVRVKNLQATVKGPNDAWGRRNRPQPIQISAKVELRQPFSATSRADALASDTVHYGLLSKAILTSLERLANETAAERAPWPFSLSEVLTYIWLDLTGFYPTGERAEGQEPFLDTSVVRCLEMTAHLPKASLVGDGVSFTFTGVFGNDLNSTSMRVYGRTLKLHNMRVPTLIGLNDNEREAKQAAIVNVEIDNYEATSDIFNSLEAKIVDRMENTTFGTLEALVVDLSETITLYLRVEGAESRDGTGSQLKIAVEKPMAVPFADAPCVELRTNTRDVMLPAMYN